MDSQSAAGSPQATWLNDFNSNRNASFFDNVANTPPALSNAGMQSMSYAHPSPFSSLPIRSVENSPAPTGSPYSWSAFLVTGTPFMSPGRLDITSPQLEIYPVGSHAAVDITSDQEPDIHTTANSPEPQNSPPLRTRLSPANWESHRPKIKKLYIDQNLSLKETRQVLKDEHGFDASRKQYTAKIKEWGFVKNIPSSKADWMLKKADKRKEQHRKETVFHFGEREWTVERIQRSAKRAKTPRAEDTDTRTPSDITYSTPSYHQQGGDAIPPDYLVAPSTPSAPSSAPNLPANYLRLVWNGQTRLDLENTYREAQFLERTGKSKEAEPKFRQVLAGLENLLTPTHEDTNKAAYYLADFYARQNRMRDADMVLNRIIDVHMGRWGIEHKKTRAQLVHVADLFHQWSRTEDAITLLTRTVDTHQDLLQHTNYSSSPPRSSQGQIIYPQYSSPEGTHSHIGQQAPNFPAPGQQRCEPTKVQCQMGLAKARILARVPGDENPEELLVDLVRQCERYPVKLGVQILEINHALLELYQISGRLDDVSKSLVDSEKAFWSIMRSESQKTALLFRAAVDLCALYVKHEQYNSSNLMFEEIQSQVVDVFGIDHGLTISVLISIGVVYQKLGKWIDAQPRFEQALAASMTANGLESIMTQELEDALENRCYVTLRSLSQRSTSATGEGRSQCLGQHFGCCNTESLLSTFERSNYDE